MKLYIIIFNSKRKADPKENDYYQKLKSLEKQFTISPNTQNLNSPNLASEEDSNQKNRFQLIKSPTTSEKTKETFSKYSETSRENRNPQTQIGIREYHVRNHIYKQSSNL